MKTWPEQLYRLLPAVYQIRDGEQGDALRMLLHVVGEQVQDIHDDIETLYDNWFVETCEDWVVPYLGDLVGFRHVGDAGQPGDAASPQGRLLNRFLFPRREIANVVRRRRRKGTLSVLEDLASDVTGWRSRAVEFSRLVTFFQNVKHPEPTLGRTVCVRDREAVARLNTPFDRIAHTVDVRQIQSLPGVGWYHPYKVGLFVWRRPVYSATQVTPCRLCCNVDGNHVRAYTFSRLGQRLPLYINPRKETDELGIASERNLPLPLARHLLRDKDGHASADYYGFDESTSLGISVRWTQDGDWEQIPNARVRVCNLRDEHRWRAVTHSLPCRDLAVDPECGLFLLNTHEDPCAVRVSYYYSFGADLGGGEYDRRPPQYLEMQTVRIRAGDSLIGCGSRRLFDEVETILKSSSQITPTCGGRSRSLPADKVPFRKVDANGNDCNKSDENCHWLVQESFCIELAGSNTFEIDAGETLEIAPGMTLEIRSARRSWPLLQIVAHGLHLCGHPWRVQLGVGSRLILGGLQVCGATVQLEDTPRNEGDENPVAAGRPVASACQPCATNSTDVTSVTSSLAAEVIVRHTTFVPGGRASNGSCHCQPNHASLTACLENARICIQRSIVGTLNIEHPRCRRTCQPDPSQSTCPLDPIHVQIADSIIDAAYGLPAIHANCCSPAHAELVVERSTILGDICVQQIERAENSLFAGIVHVQRRSHGYMRFCYVPTHPNELPALNDGEHRCRSLSALRCVADDAVDWLKHTLMGTASDPSGADCCHRIRTPQRFKCLPDTDGQTQTSSCSIGCGGQETLCGTPAPSRLRPVFVSTHYGDPGYGQLALDCPRAILRGADDESELGAFHDLYHPQRMAALEARLQEYTPADMQSAVIYADDLPTANTPYPVHTKP